MTPTKDLSDCIQNDRRIPIRSRDGTYIRALLANRCLTHPSNRKVSGFLGLLDDIESDLGGKPPHVGTIGEIPVKPFSRNEPAGLANVSSLNRREILCRFTGRRPETNGEWLLLIIYATVIKNCFPL